MAYVGDTPIEAGEPPAVEMFGVLEILLSTDSASGYKDVDKLKGRKKIPFQASTYRIGERTTSTSAHL